MALFRKRQEEDEEWDIIPDEHYQPDDAQPSSQPYAPYNGFHEQTRNIPQHGPYQPPLQSQPPMHQSQGYGQSSPNYYGQPTSPYLQPQPMQYGNQIESQEEGYGESSKKSKKKKKKSQKKAMKQAKKQAKLEAKAQKAAAAAPQSASEYELEDSYLYDEPDYLSAKSFNAYEKEEKPFVLPKKKIAIITSIALAFCIAVLGVFNTDFDSKGNAYIIPLDIHYEREYVVKSDVVYDYLMALEKKLPDQLDTIANNYVSVAATVKDEYDALKTKTDSLSRYTNVPKTLTSYHSALLNLSISTEDYLSNLQTYYSTYSASDYASWSQSGYSDFSNKLAEIHLLRIQVNEMIFRNMSSKSASSIASSSSNLNDTTEDNGTTNSTDNDSSLENLQNDATNATNTTNNQTQSGQTGNTTNDSNNTTGNKTNGTTGNKTNSNSFGSNETQGSSSNQTQTDSSSQASQQASDMASSTTTN